MKRLSSKPIWNLNRMVIASLIAGAFTGSALADPSLLVDPNITSAGGKLQLNGGTGLRVSGTTALNATDVNGALNVNASAVGGGQLYVEGTTTLLSDLNVGGTYYTTNGDINTINGNITSTNGTVSGNDITASNNANIGHNVNVGNRLTVVGNAGVGGNFNVTGNTTLNTTNVGGALNVNATAGGGGQLYVEGTTTLKSDLNVDGTYYTTNGDINTVNGNITTTNGTLSSQNLQVSSDAGVGGNLGVTGNSKVGGKLGVAGDTSLGGKLGVAGDTNLGGNLGVAGNSSVNGNLGVAGNANVNGNLGVAGNANVNGNLGVAGNANVNGNLGVTGKITGLNGTSISANKGGGLTGTNQLSVGTTKTVQINSNQGANAVAYGTQVDGGMLVNGDLGINGNIYANSPQGNISLQVGNNGLNIQGANNSVSLTSQANNANPNKAQVQLGTDNQTGNSSASVTVTNSLGNTHGLYIDPNNTHQTVLSGGNHSTSLTLNDSGASFANSIGGPARVTGVADGIGAYDAVNVRQLSNVATRAYSGIAQIAAMQGLATPTGGRNYAVGIGGGFYAGQQAIAFGVKANVADNFQVGASMATGFGSTSSMAAAVNAGFVW